MHNIRDEPVPVEVSLLENTEFKQIISMYVQDDLDPEVNRQLSQIVVLIVR